MDRVVVASLTVIAAYDVCEDQRRARLAAMLQTLGDRVQKSVFVILLDADELAELQAQSLKLINPDTDSLMLFRQCETCWQSKVALGQGHAPEGVTHWLVI